MTSLFRLDLLRRAWGDFKASASDTWKRACAVCRGGAVLAVGLTGALGVLAGSVLLWLAVVFLFPPTGQVLGSYANQFLTYSKVANEALYVLAHELGYVSKVNVQYKKEYSDPKHGTSITIPKPPRYTVRSGDAAQVQSMVQPGVQMVVQPVVGVDLAVTDTEMAMITDEWPTYRKKFVVPAMSQLATYLDAQLAAQYANVYNMVTPAVVGTLPNTAQLQLALFSAAQQRLDEEAAPKSDRHMVLGPRAYWNAIPLLTGNFVKDVIDEAELEGRIRMPLLGIDTIGMTQNAPTKTVGVFGGAPVVGAGGQSGLSLVTAGWTAGSILKAGDVFTIAGVFAVFPQTRLSTGSLKQFVVGAGGALADAGGNMTIPLGNPLNPPVGGLAQQFQTVDSFPAGGAALTVIDGTTGQTVGENILFQRDAFGLCTFPQFIARDAHYAEMLEVDGLAMRAWLFSDGTNNRQVLRLDVLAAWATLYQEAACRISN